MWRALSRPASRWGGHCPNLWQNNSSRLVILSSVIANFPLVLGGDVRHGHRPSVALAAGVPRQARAPAPPGAPAGRARRPPAPLLTLVRALGARGDRAILLAPSRLEGLGGGRPGEGLYLGLRLEGGEGAGGEGGGEGAGGELAAMGRRVDGGEVGPEPLLPLGALLHRLLASRGFLGPTEFVFEEIHPQTFVCMRGGGVGGSLAAPRTHLHWRGLTKRGQKITLIPRLIGSIYNNIGPASLTALHYHPLSWLSLVSSCFYLFLC